MVFHRQVFVLLALGLLGAGTAGVAAPVAPSAPPVRGCFVLPGLHDPLRSVQALGTTPTPSRRERLVAQLRTEAQVAAAPFALELKKQGGTRIRVLWAAGVICAEGPPALFRRLAGKSGGPEFFFDSPVEEEALSDDTAARGLTAPPEAPLVALKVPEVWARGIDGRGVVIGHIDTGIDFLHTDLKDHLWTNQREIPGNLIDDDGNGHVDDIHGWDFSEDDADPSDGAGHGTSTAGLLVGDGRSGRATGTAPGAQLMVVRRGSTQALIWEAIEYAIEEGAQVISMSASWRWVFNPKPQYAQWRRLADTELAAGIIHVNSAGNNGLTLDTDPLPFNLGAPANCPPPWLPPDQNPRGGVSAVLAAGNLDARSLALVATSSRGPAAWFDIARDFDPDYPDPMPLEYQDYPYAPPAGGLIKPDFVLPGDGSTSTIRGGGYGPFSGTSAAAPRLAGIIALLRQSAPTATPAEIAEVLFRSAGDMGNPGHDNQHGAGMPDALAALEALGPTVAVLAVRVAEDPPPAGDGDGNADAGEIVRLSLTLANTGDLPLDGLDLVLASRGLGKVRDPFVRLAGLPAAGSVDVSGFSLELPAGSCGQSAELVLEVRAGGRVRRLPVSLPIGTETRTTLWFSDGEADPGFIVGGTANNSGWFTREAPVGTQQNGEWANPPTDASGKTGAACFITGNGPTDPDAADVDGGYAELKTPARNAVGFQRVELSYRRWFFSADPNGEDSFRVDASADGSGWTALESFSATENRWRKIDIVLSDRLDPGEATSVRFRCDDAGGPDIVECGLDDLSLIGVGLACTPYEIPSHPAPSPVGPTLRLAPVAGGHLELTWAPPSVAGGIDPPRGYQVLSSGTSQGPFALIGQPWGPHWVIVDGMTPRPGEIQFFLVESNP